MKTAKMTIRLPGSELAFAKHYAKEQGMTLTDLVLRYLGRLPREAVNGIPDEVRRVAGIVPAEVDAKAEHREHALRRHV